MSTTSENPPELATPATELQVQPLSIGAIAGIAVSAVFVLTLLILLICYCKSRNSYEDNLSDDSNSENSKMGKSVDASETTVCVAVDAGMINITQKKSKYKAVQNNIYEEASNFNTTNNIVNHSRPSEDDKSGDSYSSLKTSSNNSKIPTSSTIDPDNIYDVPENLQDSSETSKMTVNVLYHSYQSDVNDADNKNI